MGKRVSTYFLLLVHNISQNDVLYVRNKPDRYSKKVGFANPDTKLAIEFYEKFGKSTWCRVHDLPPIFYFGDGYDFEMKKDTITKMQP